MSESGATEESSKTTLQSTFEPSAHVGKRVLFALIFDYYLFDYYRHLAPRLIKDGFNVSILAGDRRTQQKIKKNVPTVEVVLLPPWIRWASNRSRETIPRIMLWILAWLWSSCMRHRFDFVIVPWDYRVVWHTISRMMPALTIHNTTDFLDIDLKLNRLYLPDVEAKKSFHKFWQAVDRLFGGRLLPRANGHFLRYGKKWLIDRFLGYRGENAQQGFSGVCYLSVMGDAIKSNYQRLGVGVPPSPTEIVVTGSPSYESLMQLPVSFRAENRRALRASLGVPLDAFLCSLFLSPSTFSDEQVAEISEVVRALGGARPDIWFVLKFHPKTRVGESEKVLASLGVTGKRTTIVTEFRGDEWNGKLVLTSDCLVQKQSTVGYLAMIYGVPVLSYNLKPTNYDDEMYKLIGGSYHAESCTELITHLNILFDSDGRRRLAEMQAEACRKFCRTGSSPCGEISAVIQRHFYNERRSSSGPVSDQG